MPIGNTNSPSLRYCPAPLSCKLNSLTLLVRGSYHRLSALGSVVVNQCLTCYACLVPNLAHAATRTLESLLAGMILCLGTVRWETWSHSGPKMWDVRRCHGIYESWSQRCPSQILPSTSTHTFTVSGACICWCTTCGLFEPQRACTSLQGLDAHHHYLRSCI